MRNIFKDTHGAIAALIGGVIALLVSIIVGVLVWYKLDASITNGARPAAVGLLYNNTNTTANTIWTLAPIVAIVLVASVILGIVASFGSGGQQM